MGFKDGEGKDKVTQKTLASNCPSASIFKSPRCAVYTQEKLYPAGAHNISNNVWWYQLSFCGRREGMTSNQGSEYLIKSFVEVHGAPVMIPRVNNLCFPLGEDCRLRSTKGRAFIHSRLDAAQVFANWFWIMPLVLSTRPEDWGW